MTKTIMANSNISNSKKDKEQLVIEKELDVYAKAAKEMLSAANEVQIKKAISNPSAAALSTTKHDAGSGLDRVRKNPRQLFNLYMTNQFVARAINVRADTMVTKGYKIVGEDEKAIEACTNLIEESGGPRLFTQLAINTDIAGDGFLEKIYSKDKKAILKLKHVHPLTMTFKKDITTDKIMVDSNGQPIGYVQYYMDKTGTEQIKPVPLDRISHFRFNVLGDEFTGLSAIQPGYDTIVRLMNMEYSAAEAAVKSANPLIVVHTYSKSPKQVAQWATILGNITGKDELFLPEDMEIEFKAPGAQNFSDYAAYFLDAVVATFGVPKAVLLGQGGSGGNRAESIVLTRHFYSQIRRNQLSLEEFFYEIFLEYAELAGFEAPKLLFDDVAEDASVASDQAIALYESGLITREEAREIVGLETFLSGKPDVEGEVKKSDMETWHPDAPGSAAGKQDGEKRAMETSPNSTFKAGKTKTDTSM